MDSYRERERERETENKSRAPTCLNNSCVSQRKDIWRPSVGWRPLLVGWRPSQRISQSRSTRSSQLQLLLPQPNVPHLLQFSPDPTCLQLETLALFFWQQRERVATKPFRRHRAHMHPSECLSSFLSSHCQIKLSILSSPALVPPSRVRYVPRFLSRPGYCTVSPSATLQGPLLVWWLSLSTQNCCSGVPLTYVLVLFCEKAASACTPKHKSRHALFFSVLMKCRGVDSGVLC